MTQEEYNAKVNEYNSLVNQYNNLVRENESLEIEIETGVENCYVVAGNINQISSPITRNIKNLAENLDEAREVVDNLHACLVDITEKYFTFKNLSGASKALTQYNDVYFTKFKFYNELRRITLGYVIGIDANIVSSETLRKKVEKAYLANTDYWLAYAISAVMLWASDEKEAAYRALNKSLTMDCYKTSVFFMLVNLRFDRMSTARNWFVSLLEKTDVNNIHEEWQHVLRLYLIGALRNDDELHSIAEDYFEKMLQQTEATNAEFAKKVVERSYKYAETFIHKTETEFGEMNAYCPEYQDMKHLLNESEKISALVKYYDDVFNMEEDKADNMDEQIENILYDLINAYDDEEFKVVKEIKLNEAIMAAKGDIKAANAKFQETYGNMYQTTTFGDLMIKWAFSEDYKATDIIIKRFSINRFKEYLKKGFRMYFEDCKNRLKDKYPVIVAICHNVPPLSIECDENQMDMAQEKITRHFEKSKVKFILADKYIKIFMFMCAGALLLLAIAALAVRTSAFPVLLTLGIALGVVSGFLVWKRWTDVGNILKDKCRTAIVKFRSALDEMAIWRRQTLKNFKELDNIANIIDKF